MKKKAVVGMSGGVDSSVAAYLLKERGYDVIGVTMEIWPKDAKGEDGGCCGLSAAEDAAEVADRIGIPHYVMNFREIFEEKVIRYFVEEYRSARTPNPCVACNTYIKWDALLKKALALGADYIATGHYANVEHLANGRWTLRKSACLEKDQTYVLCGLNQEQLAHTLMPIGDHNKSEVRQIAAAIGLEVADKPDSQDICFVTDHDYAGFIEEYTGESFAPGNYVDTEGNVLGRHQGLIHYTIGQRKGLGIAAGHPLFVTELRPQTNEVVLGTADEVFGETLIATNLNFMAVPPMRVGDEMDVTAKIRYRHEGAPCRIRLTEEDRLFCRFLEPVRAITPGQTMALYDGDLLVGGAKVNAAH